VAGEWQKSREGQEVSGSGRKERDKGSCSHGRVAIKARKVTRCQQRSRGTAKDNTVLVRLRYFEHGRLNQWAHWARAQGPRIFVSF